jgi:Mg2+ and Co2+ transporter CorA
LLRKDELLLTQLDDLRSQLSITRLTVESNAQLTTSLVEELNEKHISDMKQQEDRVQKLGELVDHLHQLLEARELSQRRLLEEDSPSALMKSYNLEMRS